MLDRITDLERLSTLCGEAVSAHGDDWPSIQRHISAELDRLDKSERNRLDAIVRWLIPATPQPGRKSH